MNDAQLLIDAVPTGLLMTDAGGRCTRANPAAGAVFGRSADEMVGLDLSEIPEGIRDGKRTLDVSITRGDGSTVRVRYSASPIVRDGETVAFAVSVTDVTTESLLQEELERSKRLETIGRLGAMFAHEFNNVLMGITPFIDIIRRGRNVEAAAEHISKAVARGKRITQDVLRFAHTATPDLAPIRVEPWLSEIAAEASSLLSQNQRVDVDVQDSTISIRGDVTQLQQAFTNLILNARDAMAGGGVLTLAVRRELAGTRFPFGVVDHPERVAHFIVRDTGSGMTPEIVAQIFEPLFTTKRNGTGLGLPVVRQVISRHGGNIFVESALGVGTAFHIFLPLAGLAQRILLVEDDETVASALVELLELEQREVEHVVTGASAIEAVRRRRPDVVILDIGLPDMDGLAVYEWIDDTDPTLPVVFSTAHGNRVQLESVRRSNVTHLLKPYDIEALLAAIRHVTTI